MSDTVNDRSQSASLCHVPSSASAAGHRHGNAQREAYHADADAAGNWPAPTSAAAGATENLATKNSPAPGQCGHVVP